MKRALIIGCQTYGLTGVKHDVRVMAEVLGKIGFKTEVVQGAAACRQGILEALASLSAALNPEDQVILYYAGHGGRAPNPNWSPESREARYLFFFVPTDMASGHREDFRGILEQEFSYRLTKLTQKTKNVTVLLDCCHSARLVRSARGRPRTLKQIWRLGIEHHVRETAQTNLAASHHVTDNPDAVRIAAAGPHQSAFEDPSGVSGGYFTEILAEILPEAATSRLTWESVGAWIREQVLVMEPRQRVHLGGPVQRRVVETEYRLSPRCGEPSDQQFTFFYDPSADEAPSMRAGLLHGVVPGNRYVANQFGKGHGSKTVVEVTHAMAGISRVQFLDKQKQEDECEVLDGTALLPVRSLFPKRQVRLAADFMDTGFGRAASGRGSAGGTSAGNSLRTGINRSPMLCVAGEALGKPFASVTFGPHGWIVSDGSGDCFTRPTQKIGEIVNHLENLARAMTLRDLHDQYEGRATLNFSLEWGRVSNKGQAMPVQMDSPLMYSGDKLYVRVRNTGLQSIYLNLFDIGVSKKVTLLNAMARSGYELTPEESWCFGYRPNLGLQGVPISWPDSVVSDRPRLENIVAVVSDQPLDLSILAGGRGNRRNQKPSSALESYVRARCSGGNRSHQSLDSDLRFAIHLIDFELHPKQRTNA